MNRKNIIRMLTIAVLSIGCTEEKLEGLIDGNGHVAGRLGVGTIVVDGQATATRATAENGTSGAVNGKGVFSLPPNVAIISLAEGDTLSVAYSFDGGTTMHTGTAMLRADNVWGLDVLPISPEKGNATESWAGTRMSVVCRAGSKSAATIVVQGMNCIATKEGTITGVTGKLPTRSFMDALVAETDVNGNVANEQAEGAVKEGMVYVDRGEESPRLGRFSASLVHAGALMRLKAADVSTETEGLALKELWAKVTVAAETFYVPFTTVTVGSTAMWQAIVPDKAEVSAFVVISGETAETDVTKFSTSTMTSKTQTLARNLRYPLTLKISNRTKAVVEFATPAGLPGWGTQETEMVDWSKHLRLESESNGVHSYKVYSANGLMKVSEWINSATDVPAPQSTNTAVVSRNNRMQTNITLMRSIVLPEVAEGESNWTPIGDNIDEASYKDPYRGTFDGGGYTITGLTISTRTLFYAALISKNAGMVRDLTIKDVNIENAKFNGISRDGTTAAVVGVNSGGYVLNCHLTGTGKMNGSKVGGIVGHNTNYVIACSNNSTVVITVTGSANRGSLIGYNGKKETFIGSWSNSSLALATSDQGQPGTHCYSSSDVSEINSHVAEMNAAIADYNHSYSQTDITKQCLYVWKAGANLNKDMPTSTPPPAIVFDKASGTYSVRTAEKLIELNKWLANSGPVPMDENGQGYTGSEEDRNKINITLTADITLTGTNNWISKPYAGQIDGKGYTISGLNNSYGLIYLLGPRGIIKNLTLEDVVIQSTDASGFVGAGAFACTNDGSIINCQIKGNSRISGIAPVGGIAGILNGNITDCHVRDKCSISGGMNVGGIVGEQKRTSTISGCSNNAKVSHESTLSLKNCLGGIAGSSTYGKINSSFNTGVIEGTTKVGGIVGDGYGTISVCYNTGPVSGSDMVGGIVGYSHGMADNGDVYGSWNAGKVSLSSGTSIYIGSMVGRTKNYNYVLGCFPPLSEMFGGGGVPYIGFGNVNNAINAGTVTAIGWTWMANRDTEKVPTLKKNN